MKRPQTADERAAFAAGAVTLDLDEDREPGRCEDCGEYGVTRNIYYFDRPRRLCDDCVSMRVPGGEAMSYDDGLDLIPTDEARVMCRCGHPRVIHRREPDGSVRCGAPACADGCCHCADCSGFVPGDAA